VPWAGIELGSFVEEAFRSVDVWEIQGTVLTTDLSISRPHR